MTPRLQTLIQKDLKLDRLDNAIDYCWDEGIVVKGFFMLGFPTESPRELLSTVWFALKSNLTMASFFTVVPQPETPLYDLALQEGAKGLEALKHQNYYGQGWYELSTGFPLNLVVKLSVISFYFLSPRRVHRLFRVLGIRRAGRAFYQFLSLISPVELQHLRIRKLRLGTPARPQPIPKGAP